VISPAPLCRVQQRDQKLDCGSSEACTTSFFDLCAESAAYRPGVFAQIYNCLKNLEGTDGGSPCGAAAQSCVQAAKDAACPALIPAASTYQCTHVAASCPTGHDGGNSGISANQCERALAPLIQSGVTMALDCYRDEISSSAESIDCETTFTECLSGGVE
jgi:hypothetical protein